MRNPHIETLFFGLAHNSGFQELSSRVGSRERYGALRLSGLTLTARAVYAALLYRETGRPQIIITDGNKQAEALYPLLRTFCDLLDAGTVPLLLSALDVMPGQGMSPHAEILATRAVWSLRASSALSMVTATKCVFVPGAHRATRSMSVEITVATIA